MSFILDALRKSEHERQRQTGPGIADLTPVSARPGLPVWAIALGALLVVNIAVVLVLVLRGEPAPTPASLPESALQSIAPAMAPAGAATQPVPALIDNAPQSATRSARAEPELEESPMDTGEFEGIEQEPPAEPKQRSDPELAAAVRAAVEDDGADVTLPTLNDVTLQGSNIPELHLDIHVYGTAPADRFVFINMRKYREGGQTPEGTRVERITRDGVVLNHRGVRFLLPRQ